MSCAIFQFYLRLQHGKITFVEDLNVGDFAQGYRFVKTAIDRIDLEPECFSGQVKIPVQVCVDLFLKIVLAVIVKSFYQRVQRVILREQGYGSEPIEKKETECFFHEHHFHSQKSGGVVLPPYDLQSRHDRGAVEYPITGAPGGAIAWINQVASFTIFGRSARKIVSSKQ